MKRLRPIENKNEGQLKILKDQAEKQPIISKNVSFKSLLDADSRKVFDDINEKDLPGDYSNPTFVGSSKKYTFDYKSFMSLGSLAKNIYNGNVSLNTAKQKQRNRKYS